MPSRIVLPCWVSRAGLPVRVAAVLVMLMGLAALASFLASTPHHVSYAAPVRPLAQALDRLPLSFTENQGQTDARVDYLARGPGYLLFLNGEGAVWKFDAPASSIALNKRAAASSTRFEARSVERKAIDTTPPNATLTMSLAGARAQPKPIAEARQPGRSNYFIGKDPAKWVKGASNYARIRYEDVYAGVDLVYYGNQRQLEYDFIVAPHADASRILFAFNGARAAHLNESGDLVLDVDGREVIQRKPVAYQRRGDQQMPVDAAFRLESRSGPSAPIEVALTVGDYDTERDLSHRSGAGVFDLRIGQQR